MNMTRWYLGVALVFTSILGNLSVYAEEEARDLEEVVVTSRRRDESQQDVPLSVTAFNSERIEQLKPKGNPSKAPRKSIQRAILS